MFMKSKSWMLLAAIGQGVLFSLALTGAVRISYWLLGKTLSESAAGNLLLASSLLTGGLCAFLYLRYRKAAVVAAGEENGHKG
ncbi:MAG: hypothetical protein AB7O62_25790 [Pirellulales bacterium]